MEYEERNYIKEYIFLWLKVLGLLVIGYLIDTVALADYNIHVATYILPITIYGLTFIKEHDSFYLFGNSDLVTYFWILKFLFLIFKLIIAALIGLIAFPIVNIYYIVKIVKYNILKKHSSNN
ncbi:MAG: hypothetical protein HDR19_02030 [Lachnospiraceae bacterium]|nr:hypothetical protein [Lachnospiraceae bacterium]